MKRFINKELLEEYGRWLYEKERSIGTIRKYYYYLELLEEYLDGRELSKALVIRWKDSLREALAPSTVNGALAAVNSLFRYKGWTDCVMKFIRIGRRVFCPEQRELSRQEYVRLVQAANRSGDERTALVIQTICSTGMRVSELKYVTVEALDSRTVEVECKGKVRTIFLTKKLCRLLREYAKKKNICRGMIFITRTGKAMDRSNIWREMKKIGEKAGVSLKKVFPHNLRHLFARSYYRQEKDLLRLSEILGHSSINTTRIYTMESGEEHVRQLEKLDLVIDYCDRIPLLL